MEDFMKKALLNICLAIGMIIGLMGSAHAQLGTQFKAHIPYDFNIGNSKLKAGDYIIKLTNPASSQQSLTISSIAGDFSKIALVIPMDTGSRREVSKLVFNRYGDQYYLAQMKSPSFGADFRKTKNEAMLAKKQKSVTETVALNK